MKTNDLNFGRKSHSGIFDRKIGYRTGASLPRMFRQVIELLIGEVVARNKSTSTYASRSETVIFQLDA